MWQQADDNGAARFRDGTGTGTHRVHQSTTAHAHTASERASAGECRWFVKGIKYLTRKKAEDRLCMYVCVSAQYRIQTKSEIYVALLYVCLVHGNRNLQSNHLCHQSSHPVDYIFRLNYICCCCWCCCWTLVSYIFFCSINISIREHIIEKSFKYICMYR